MQQGRQRLRRRHRLEQQQHRSFVRASFHLGKEEEESNKFPMGVTSQEVEWWREDGMEGSRETLLLVECDAHT